MQDAPGKVTDLAFTLGTVEAFDVIVAVGGACDGVFSPAVQPEGAELDTDRAGYDAPSAKQAVVGYRIGQGVFFFALPFSRYMHIFTEIPLIFLRRYNLRSGPPP